MIDDKYLEKLENGEITGDEYNKMISDVKESLESEITSSLLTDDSGRKVAPSEYYSKYTFDANTGTKLEILTGQPVVAKYISDTKSTSITLYSTSVYIEYQYSLSTFPNGGNILRVDDFGVHKVKQSKLVSVTQ